MERKDLLLAEYQQYSDAYWKNEEAGERRLTFFITLTTAIIAALVALRAKDVQIGGGELKLITGAALVGILIFGMATFFRILQRDRVTDEYKGILRYLRERMREEADLGDYVLPFLPRRHWLLRGGLAVTTALLNGFVLSLLVGLAIPMDWDPIRKGGYLVLVFLVAFGLQASVIRLRRSEATSQTFRAGVGAMIFNDRGEVLALKRRDVENAWQLPQGGIEWGETPDHAVMREIAEETGIPARLLTAKERVDGLFAYELPEGKRSNKTVRGQVQYWYRFRFIGTDKDIRPKGDDKNTIGNGHPTDDARHIWRRLLVSRGWFGAQAPAEFVDFEWRSFASLAASIVDFKGPVYQTLLDRMQNSKRT